MAVKIIVAVSENGVIGKDNGIPWRQKHDMQMFKDRTIGNIVVMGSRTYDSLGQKPLKDRTNIIVTSNIDRYKSIHTDHKLPIVFSTTFQFAIDTAKRFAKSFNNDIFIIGGENIYRQALNEIKIDQILLTRIHTTLDGDRFFPELDKSWSLMSSIINFPANENNTYSYSFCVYEKQ